MVDAKPKQKSPDIDRLFPKGFEEQRAAAEVALSQGLTVLTGGPGTGKTTTVARLLALLTGGTHLRIALAAPTGKAAARLQEAVQLEVAKLEPADRQALAELHATTLHRLLGSRPDTSARFRHNRGNRLPHDVIVVDETSMVSLTMMARLLEAVRPDARLILVGDPDQLASVEAGAVLADLVDGLDSSKIAELRTSHRFGESIGALASAIRDGDADTAVDVLRSRWRAHRVDRGRRAVGTPSESACAPCRCAATGRAAWRCRRRAKDTRRASVVVRAPTRALRSPILESPDRAVADRGDRRADMGILVSRQANPCDGKRLRSRPLQRRHGRDTAQRTACYAQ